MPFKCGHCGNKHETVSQARKCAASKNVPKEQRDEYLSMGAQKYLGDLLRQFRLVLAGGQTINMIPRQDGKKILEGLIDARRFKTTGKPYSLPDGVLQDPTAGGKTGERPPTPKKLPDCPPGYYAVPDWTGKEEFKFFRVKLIDKEDDKWYGWTFVDKVVGGHVDSPARGRFAVKAVEAILDFGIDNAGFLYATKIKQCSNCNRSLTKKASREIGLGRNCADRKGRGEEWDSLNYHYHDADAED